MTKIKWTISIIILVLFVYKPVFTNEEKSQDMQIEYDKNGSMNTPQSADKSNLLDKLNPHPVKHLQPGTDSDNSFYDSSLSSDERSSRFAIYGTLGGYTLLVGLGVEYLFTDWLGLNVNVGGYNITYTNLSGNKVTEGVFAVPILLSFYLGKGKKRFYFEGGVGYYNGDGLSETDSIIGNQSSAKAIFGLGFNLFPLNGGFYLKVGASFIVTGGNRDGVGLWMTRPVFFMPRVSLGYAF